MMIKFVYKILPAFIIQSNNIPNDYVGYEIGNFIKIRPDNINNENIIRHELEHVKQFYGTLGIHSFLYLLSPKYRLYSESEAYAAQIGPKASDSQIECVIDWLFLNYKLKMTKEAIATYFINKLNSL